MPDYMNAVDYMRAVNELNYNDFPGGGWYQTYTKDVVDNYWNLNREDPDKYPNTDWLSLLLKDYAGATVAQRFLPFGKRQTEHVAEFRVRRRGRSFYEKSFLEALYAAAEQRFRTFQMDEGVGRHFPTQNGQGEPPYFAVGPDALYSGHLRATLSDGR